MHWCIHLWITLWYFYDTIMAITFRHVWTFPLTWLIAQPLTLNVFTLGLDSIHMTGVVCQMELAAIVIAAFRHKAHSAWTQTCVWLWHLYILPLMESPVPLRVQLTPNFKENSILKPKLVAPSSVRADLEVVYCMLSTVKVRDF